MEGLHAGPLFREVNLGTGWETVGGEPRKEGKRTGERMHHLKLLTRVDDWGTISLGPSGNPLECISELPTNVYLPARIFHASRVRRELLIALHFQTAYAECQAGSHKSALL